MRRRFWAPEVIQSSAMDCGPAALKCLAEGFGIAISYGRLREACQTGVDGTSIDSIEECARAIGLEAEQVMLPVDHLFLPEAQALPAMVVTRQADGMSHFTVIWRQLGPWLQVMDPGVGRRWVSQGRFSEQLLRHELAVSAEDWYGWAVSEDFLAPLRSRLEALGGLRSQREEMLEGVLSRGQWRALASLDAAVRMVASLLRAGALASGSAALALARTLIEEAGRLPRGESGAIPPVYWSVRPMPDSGDGQGERLIMGGAVLVRIRGRLEVQPGGGTWDRDGAPLSAELRAALEEAPAKPERILLGLLPFQAWVTPMALLLATLAAAAAVLAENLLFRGLFDIAPSLGLTEQRFGAMLGLLAFMAIVLLLEIPIGLETLRLGRHLELRLRQSLLEKLPKLSDRYFQSRAVSDMAERAHSVYLTRLVPDLAIRALKTCGDLGFTVLGIILVAPASAVPALIMGGLAVGLPLAAQPILNERDLRVRSHVGALYGFYLDALLGLVAVRTHGAERSLRNEHDARLVEWARSSRRLVGCFLAAQGSQTLACLAVGAWLLWENLQVSGITGNVLLLVYWTLKIPASAKQLSTLARQYPAQRNALLRLLEPLATPEEEAGETETLGAGMVSVLERGRQQPRRSHGKAGAAIRIRAGSVVAAGHTILSDIDLEVAPGEHIAIVGPSGAGKSSLLALLLGWQGLAEGSLEVDGRSLSRGHRRELLRSTAWVDPSVQLWNRPLLENLLYSAPEGGETGRVLGAAALRGIVQKLPLGLQTPLGEGGALVSGGEGQRVRFGRALMQKEVRLALLDEPFRGLDHGQRRLLLQQARAWWEGCTLLCVTHDLAETLEFDRVWVIEGGRLVEDGSPVALANRPSRYGKLLNMERSLREELWQADFWQRIRVENGLIVQAKGEESLERHRSQRAGLARG